MEMEILYRDLIFIRKVIKSCETEEQRKTAYAWAVKWKKMMSKHYSGTLGSAFVLFGWHLIMSDLKR